MALRASPPRKRRYLPFDGSWGMRVALPVSQAVVVGGNAWTCGQCDLDPGGGTRHAGDRLAQTGPVMTHLMRVLTTAGVLPGAPLHIHAFYVDDDTIDESAWAAQLMEQLPPDTAAALYLTPLAALGYPGMVTEIDAVASVTPTSDTGGETGGQSGAVDACRVGDLVYSAGLDAGIGAPAVAAATLLGRLEQAFRSAGASIADVVKLNLLHEAALDTQDLTAIETTLAAGLVAAGCRVPPVFSIVPLARLPAAGGWRLQGIALTGAAAAAPRRSLTAGDVDWRRSGAGAWSEALVAERRVFVGMQLPVDAAGEVVHRGDMSAQTRLVMDRLSELLARFGASAQQLVKMNTWYVGGADPADLHSNLCVRAEYFRKPACPSTGVPVPGLCPAGALLMVDGIAVLDDA